MSLPDSPLQLIGILFLLSILPLIIVMGTSFLKLAVVFSILRNALGIQQVPPNIALYGLALATFLIHYGADAISCKRALASGSGRWPLLSGRLSGDSKALAPYRQFLQKNSEEKEANYFRNLIKRTWPEDIKRKIKPDSLLILIPAFTVSQLTQAFRIGLLIYLPFLLLTCLFQIYCWLWG
ncbi:type III secretion system protein [Salmonella enterica subsp. enterica]|uniref:Type III secretion system protein n=1 Tax=Salmonella enterica I TaxID=59201 RepID=A0A379WV51_SALET|nr:type III secretion system protein [Salmonella enterica subsp. enterica]